MFYALLPLPTTLPTRELTCSGSFFLDDGNLHVFDLDTDQEEVDLPHHYVPQVIPANNNRHHTQSIRTGSQYVALPQSCPAVKIEVDFILAVRHGATGQCDIL